MATASPAKPADPSPTATPAKKAVTELYSLDYDDTKDVFSLPGTTTLFTGPVISHYDDGKTESEGALKDGKQEGHWVEYHTNGKRSEEGNYEAGQEEGPWKYWFENGQLDSEGAYRAGSPVGHWVKHFESGKIDSEGDYADGLMNGPWKFYDETTGKARTIKFDRGTQLAP
jgi:antitoxin component YwqK of YwqJK toxin-antitoxin module